MEAPYRFAEILDPFYLDWYRTVIVVNGQEYMSVGVHPKEALKQIHMLSDEQFDELANKKPLYP